MAERGQWIQGNEGYFGIGYDSYVAGEIPCWTVSGLTLADITASACEWVSEATEFAGVRRVEIYYVSDSGIVEPDSPHRGHRTPDLIIKTGKSEDEDGR